MSHLGGGRGKGRKKLPITVLIAIQVAKMYIMAENCGYCGQRYNDEVEGMAKSLDHVLPICKGGTNDPANIKICHLQCNRAKARLTVDDFIDLCARICAYVGKTNK